MTVNVESNVVQEKVDTNLSQQKVDTNLSQPKIEKNSAENQQENIETTEDPNWRAFREARKKDRADREAAERRAAEKDAEVAALKAAMEAAFSKGNGQQQQQYGSQEDESEDERIEKKVQIAIAQREVANEKARREREQNELPQRLLQAYPDYNQVVSEENGAYLEYHHPELYRALLRQQENFDTCSDIYKLVKKFVPNSNSAKKESAKAEANFAKPKSISTTSLTQSGPATAANILSEDKKAANWARMQATLKGLSNG